MFNCNFDPATGTLSFNRQILNTGFDDGQGESVYDVEWSVDGSKLYISRYGSGAQGGNLYQIDTADPAELVNSILFSEVHRSYGIQRGLDGRIYHLYQLNNGSPFTIGRINYPDSAVVNVAYDSLIFNDNFASTVCHY